MNQGEQQNEKKVTIGSEDVTTIRNFFKHFKLTLTKELDAALTNFEKDKTFENQEKVCKALAEACVKDTSGLFKDKMFLPLSDESKKVAFYDQFDKDMNDILKDDKS